MANSTATTGRTATRPKSARVPRRFPIGGVFLLVSGALLILLEGVYVAASGVTIAYGYPYAPLPSASTVGWLSVLAGAVGVGLGAMIYVLPNHHIFVGAAALTVAVLDFNWGGGFVLGSLLLYVGGILSLYFNPVSVSLSPGDLPEEVLDEDPVVEADMIASGTRAR